MKIGLIGDAGSIHIKRWAYGLKRLGHEIHMADTNNSKDLNYLGAMPYDSYQLIKFDRGVGSFFNGLIMARSWARAMKLDLVHGHYLTGGGFYARWSGAKKKVVSAWGSDIYYNAKLFGQKWLAKSAINGADAIFADSDCLCQECNLLGKNAKERISKIIFGIDTNVFRPTRPVRNGFVFLSIRRTSKIYNPELILRAFAKIIDETNSTLLMAEPEQDSQDILSLVESLGLKDMVLFYKPKPYQDMPDLYNSANIGISVPSWDSSSTAMLECMSCAVPVIVSDIPCNREWISNGEGLLSSLEVSDLALRMRQAWDGGYEMMEDMGWRARMKVWRYADFDTELAKANTIYNRLSEKH